MKILKKILEIIMVSIMIISILESCDQKATSTSLRVAEGEPAKVGVLLYKMDDFISLVVQDKII